MIGVKIEINQLCHVVDSYDEYSVGRVKEIYDEYIMIKKKNGYNCRVPIDKINNSYIIMFLHKDGIPIIVERGFLGYKFP